MIGVDDPALLRGLADSLEETVLPDLARGTAARRQLQAGIALLRRVAFTTPRLMATLEADNADIAATLNDIDAVMGAPPGRHDCDHLDPAARNLALQAALEQLKTGLGEANLGDAPRAAVTSRLHALFRRMLLREMALTPPPAQRRPVTGGGQ